MYTGTSQTAKLLGISPRTLRRWIQKRLVGEPRVISKNDVGGKRGTMLIRLFGPDEVEALKRFAVRYRAETRARRQRPRNYRLDPKVKAWRAERRKAIRDTERLLRECEWFQGHPLSLKIFTLWHKTRAELDAAGLLVGDALALSALEGLEAKLGTLKTEYVAAVAKPSPARAAKSTVEERRLSNQLGSNRRPDRLN